MVIVVVVFVPREQFSISTATSFLRGGVHTRDAHDIHSGRRYIQHDEVVVVIQREVSSVHTGPREIDHKT
jgi:hypothetical protein